MKKNNQKQKGFTLLEIMLVIILLSAVLGFSVLYYQNSQVRADVNSQAAVLVSYLRLAQSNASSGQNNTFKGVHLNNNSYVMFSTTSYNSSDPNNYPITLPPVISIQSINLSGGGQDVIFTSPEGKTNNYGNLQIFSSQINKTLTINISQIGAINY